MPRAFLYTFLAVNAGLATAACIFTARQNIPVSIAVPITIAFLLQISFYLLPAFPAARGELETRFSRPQLGAVLFLAGLIPYLVYSVPTGVFHLGALLKLAAAAGVLAFIFLLSPPRKNGIAWQDLVVLAVVGIAELGKLFRQIYVSPVRDLRLESLGRFMVFGLGATAFLSLRGLEGSGYRFAISRDDWKTGAKQFLFFAPVGLIAGLSIGFMDYRPVRAAGWLYPILILGTFAGIYAVVALFEEFFFRGVLQNLLTKTLGRPLVAQAMASLIFGFSHITFRSFPNWRFVIVDSILGWFCGQAYRERRSIVASSITHTLAVTLWRMLFSA